MKHETMLLVLKKRDFFRKILKKIVGHFLGGKQISSAFYAVFGKKKTTFENAFVKDGS